MSIWDRDIAAVEEAIATIEAIRQMPATTTGITEKQRDSLHEKLMQHFERKQIDDRRGIVGPGLNLTDFELGALLRLTRAKAPEETAAS